MIEVVVLISSLYPLKIFIYKKEIIKLVPNYAPEQENNINFKNADNFRVIENDSSEEQINNEQFWQYLGTKQVRVGLIKKLIRKAVLKSILSV